MSKCDTNFIFVDWGCYYAVLTSLLLANPNHAIFIVAYLLVLSQSCLLLYI